MVYSGGAPIAAASPTEFQEQSGHYIHNIYGLTETNAPRTPYRWGEAPVDPTSGALSVGVPVFNTVVRILDEDGKEPPAGEIGEIVTAGPQVVPGYWNKPEETEQRCPAASCAPATSGSWTSRAGSSSSTARRT